MFSFFLVLSLPMFPIYRQLSPHLSLSAHFHPSSHLSSRLQDGVWINYPMEKHIHLQWSRETAEANGTNRIKPHLLAPSHYLFFFLHSSFFFSLCFFSLSISVYSCFIDFSLSSSKHFFLICQHFFIL